MKQRRHAFSLVELSIVLVILGLLVGGILAGQSLIHASELRSVMSDATRYRTAISAFRDKYFALPGDFANATSVWGANACLNTDTTAPTGTETCNGDGNGVIQWSIPNNSHGEMFLAWQHLANAGLVTGSYTGLQGPGIYAASSVGGQNVPALRLNGGCVSLHSVGTTPTGQIPPANLMNPNASSSNVLLLGKAPLTNPDYCHNGTLIPMDAWNIDTKMDDGTASNGKMFAWVTANCVNTTTPGVGDYLLTYGSAACVLVLKLDV